MLAQRVGNFTFGGGMKWNGILTTCHFATLYWLSIEALGKAPASQTEYLDWLGNDFTKVVREMLPMGRRLTRPLGGALSVQPGTVVVFVRSPNDPLHSCVASHANRLGGYNQTCWFTGTGVDHGYSNHHTSEIKWRGGVLHRDDVQSNQKHWCKLVAIPEAFAKEHVQQFVLKRIKAQQGRVVAH